MTEPTLVYRLGRFDRVHIGGFDFRTFEQDAVGYTFRRDDGMGTPVRHTHREIHAMLARGSMTVDVGWYLAS
jgi:hypothetical protein